MKKWILRITIIVFAFIAGLVVTQSSRLITLVFRKAEQKSESRLCNQSLQQSSQTPKATPTPPIMKYSSPYEIERSIRVNPEANLKEVWEYWGVDTEVKSFWGGTNNKFLSHGSAWCEAETYEYDLDGDLEAETLLHIQDGSQESSRFMVFKRDRETNETLKWKLLGYIDHDFCKYQLPTHKVYISGGKTWLVVSHLQAASGTGIALYFDRVFEIDSRGLTEVLIYMSDGHVDGGSGYPRWDISAAITNYQKRNGAEFMTVVYKVSYSAFDYKDESHFSLWSKTQRAIYRRDNTSGTFILDTSKSDVTTREIKVVYRETKSLAEDEPVYTEKDFFLYNHDELMSIAKGADSRKKEWLRNFLESCESAPRELQKLMNK